MSHGDRIEEMPPGFKAAGLPPELAVAYMGSDDKIFRPSMPS